MMNRTALQRFVRDGSGNLSPMFALTILPVVGLIGMTVDYSQSSTRKTMLDSIADSAALAGVTPTLLASTDQASIAAATTLFNGQVGLVKGIGAVTLSVTASDNGLTRTLSVSYQTTSSTLFGGFTGKSSVPISGLSQSSATVPPNIDFYLLLDNSPSMAIAATTAGINTMVANTSAQGGCAFACHESNPNADNLGNPGNEDNYTLAKNLGVVTRIQNLNSATQSLMDNATTTEQNYKSTYRMAIYT